MAEIRSFRDLNAYRKAREAARTIFEISKSFPREERYALTDQVRRSSRAVNAMIAEAWAKRLYEAAFVSKINDALGEATETQWMARPAILILNPPSSLRYSSRCSEGNP
jgi:four helix bundle protein